MIKYKSMMLKAQNLFMWVNGFGINPWNRIWLIFCAREKIQFTDYNQWVVFKNIFSKFKVITEILFECFKLEDQCCFLRKLQDPEKEIRKIY